jgi:hypothetical protein
VLRNVKSDKLAGISPERLFHEKSTDSNDSMAPIFSGIFPLRQFLDKFRYVNPSREVISAGIPPVKWLRDKSMPTI